MCVGGVLLHFIVHLFVWIHHPHHRLNTQTWFRHRRSTQPNLFMTSLNGCTRFDKMKSNKYCYLLFYVTHIRVCFYNLISNPLNFSFIHRHFYRYLHKKHEFCQIHCTRCTYTRDDVLFLTIFMTQKMKQWNKLMIVWNGVGKSIKSQTKQR